MAEPIIKWPGGKRQLLDELSARCPPNFDRYHEPFFGGGALFFHLEPDNGTINDANPRLVNLYRQVRDNVDELIEILESYPHPEADPDDDYEFSDTGRKGQEIDIFYYQQRERFNKRPNDEKFDELVEASLFLYLNRTCYNGLYRENQNGDFNAAVGSYNDPNWVQAPLLREASQVLKNVDIRVGDYSYIVDEASPNDFVYFDPPYSNTSNHAYTDARFGTSKEQEKLIEVAVDLVEQDVDVMLSNSGDMADPYEQAGLNVIVTGGDRVISKDGTNRSDTVDEVIATSVPPTDWRGGRQTSLFSFEDDS